MKIGYARVSTRDQNLDVQIEALQKGGAEQIYSDKQSGKDMDRPQFQKMVKGLRKGDHVMVWKLDRLGRSLLDLIKTLKDWDAEGITFQCLTQPIETATPVGRMILAILGAVGEMERSLISERATAGRKRAMELGVKFGPKYKLSVQQLKHMQELKARGDSPKAISLVMGISKSSVYRNLARA